MQLNIYQIFNNHDTKISCCMIDSYPNFANEWHIARIAVILLLVTCTCSRMSAQHADPLARFTIDGLRTMATTTNGAYVATAGIDSLIRVWDAETGEQVQAFPRQDTVLRVAFLPGDSTLLSVGAKDSVFYVWDWRKGTVLRKERIYRPIRYARVTENGTKLAIWVTYPEEQVEYWTIATGLYDKVIYKGERLSGEMWFNHSNTQILSWGNVGVMFLTQLVPPSRRQVPGFGARVFPGGFSSNDKHLVCGIENKAPVVLDVETLSPLFSLDTSRLKDPVFRVVYDPSGESIVTVGRTDAHYIIQRWRASDGTYIDTIVVIDSVFSRTPWVEFSADNSHMIVYLDRGPDGPSPITTWRLRSITGVAPVVPGISQAVMKVVPNPAHSMVRVLVSGIDPGRVTFSIYNCLGTPIVSRTETISASSIHAAQFDIGGFANGLYFCRVEGTAINSTTSFVVHH